MLTSPSVSVALAAYNGEKFIVEQVASILQQLKDTDELIVSDNGSTDQTLPLLKANFGNDSRLKLINCSEKGVIANFNYALKHCKNEIIFLSDQDDIWLPDKVSTCLEAFVKNPHINLVMSDITVVDNELNVIYPSFFSYRKSRLGVMKNILKNSFIGCAMAFRKGFLEENYPIPDDVPMHDMWLGIRANKKNQAMLIPKSLVLYRRHDETVTTVENHSSLKEKIVWRFKIIRYVFFHK